jgi:hypothetical protein
MAIDKNGNWVPEGHYTAVGSSPAGGGQARPASQSGTWLANFMEQQGLTVAGSSSKNPEFKNKSTKWGINAPTLDAAGSLIGGVAAGVNAYTGLQGLKLARKAFEQETKVGDANLLAQQTAYNANVAARRRYIQGTQANTDVSHLQNLQLV